MLLKKFITCFAIMLVLALSSCASFHQGAISSGPLLSSNDKHIKTAVGYASTTIILGFGGTAHDALIHNAKRDMEKTYPLAKGEYYSNYTVDLKRTIYFFGVIENDVYVHADIMSSNPDAVARDFSKSEEMKAFVGSKENFYKTKRDSFYVGEKIYLPYDGKELLQYKYYEMQIAGFDDKNTVYLYFPGGRVVTGEKDWLYYSKDKSRNGFKSGDTVVFTRHGKNIQGTVTATSPSRALVLVGQDFYEKEFADLSKQ